MFNVNFKNWFQQHCFDLEFFITPILLLNRLLSSVSPVKLLNKLKANVASYRNQSTDLLRKSNDRFLYDDKVGLLMIKL